MTEPAARCPERELLLSLWIDSAKRLRELLDWQLDALKSKTSSPPGFGDQIGLARAGEVDACRAYYGHVNAHKCV